MCRSKSEGGRRCPGAGNAAGPPGDGKTRIAVVTNKRSYTVIGGDSRVTWMPGEKVVSMDVIEPTAGYDEYMRRSAELDRRVANGESITSILAEEHAARMRERVEQIARERAGERR